MQASSIVLVAAANTGRLVGALIGLLWLVATAGVCWLKGKRLWATLGFLSGWHAVPAFRLAKPNSWWADRYYDEAKRQRALMRFGVDRVPEDYDFRPDASAISLEELAMQDKITRKAWAKAQRERDRAQSRES